MALFVIATPIGNPLDLSERARTILRSSDLVVGEELKALRQILKNAGAPEKKLDQLNEHSTQADFEFLISQCKTQNVALVSDCGTPGFCDPGAELVDLCYKAQIKVVAVPGPSSLMTLLSVSGKRLESFVFAGFAPAKTEARILFWKELAKEKKPVIVLETPYRLAKLIEDLKVHLPSRECVIGLDLTKENEIVLRGKPDHLASQIGEESREPVLLIMPAK